MNEFQTKLTQLIVDQLNEGESCWVEISSRSMSPLLQVGDQILIKPIPITQLERGMIILIEHENQLLLHRFWQFKENKLLTAADRVLAFDPYWDKPQFLGVATHRQRATKKVPLNQSIPHLYNRTLFRLLQIELRNSSISPEFKPTQLQVYMHRLLILPFIALEQMIQ